jgi:hypothetical protein
MNPKTNDNNNNEEGGDPRNHGHQRIRIIDYAQKLAQKSYLKLRKIQFSKIVHRYKNQVLNRKIQRDEIVFARIIEVPHEAVVIKEAVGKKMKENDEVFASLEDEIDLFYKSQYCLDFPLIPTNANSVENKSARSSSSSAMNVVERVAKSLGGYTSDCGWGCAARACQMLFGNAILRKALSSSKTRGNDKNFRIEKEDVNEAREMVVDAFSDDEEAVFGMRKVFACDGSYVSPGQWMAPSQICKSYARLVNREYCSSKSRDDDNEEGIVVLQNQIRCVVLGEQAIEESIEEEEENNNNNNNNNNNSSNNGGIPEFHPDKLWPSLSTPSVANDDEEKDERKKSTSKCSILVLVPLRCGAGDSINPRYIKSLKAFLALKQCVGIVGGRKSASFYIIGFTSNHKQAPDDDDDDDDDSEEEEEETEEEEEEEIIKAIYLDPHVHRQYTDPSEKTESFYDSHFNSALEYGILTHTFAELDPSLVIGFLVNDGDDDLRDFMESLKKIEKDAGTTPLISVVVVKEENNTQQHEVKTTKMSSYAVKVKEEEEEEEEEKQEEEDGDWEFL